MNSSALPRSRQAAGAPGCAHAGLVRYTVYAPSTPGLIYFRDYAECAACGLHRASNLKRVSRQAGRRYPTTREQALRGPRANAVVAHAPEAR